MATETDILLKDNSFIRDKEGCPTVNGGGVNQKNFLLSGASKGIGSSIDFKSTMDSIAIHINSAGPCSFGKENQDDRMIAELLRVKNKLNKSEATNIAIGPEMMDEYLKSLKMFQERSPIDLQNGTDSHTEELGNFANKSPKNQDNFIQKLKTFQEQFKTTDSDADHKSADKISLQPEEIELMAKLKKFQDLSNPDRASSIPSRVQELILKTSETTQSASKDDLIQNMKSFQDGGSPWPLPATVNQQVNNNTVNTNVQMISGTSSTDSTPMQEDLVEKLNMFDQCTDSLYYTEDHMNLKDVASSSAEQDSKDDLTQKVKRIRELSSSEPLDVLRNELAVISQEKLELKAHNETLVRENEELVAALAEARQEAPENIPDDKNSNSNSRVGNALEWDPDVQQLFSLSQLLSDENAKLREKMNEMQSEISGLESEIGSVNARNDDLLKEVGCLKAEKEELGGEIHRLSNEVKNAVQEAKSDIIPEFPAENNNNINEEDQKRMYEENQRLEKELSEVNEYLVAVEQHNLELQSKLQSTSNENDELCSRLSHFEEDKKAMEATISDLRSKIADEIFKAKETSQDLQKKKNSSAALEEEIKLLKSNEKSISEDLKKANSCLSSLDNTSRTLKDFPALETQISFWSKEKRRIPENKEELHKLISRFSESLTNMQQELVRWKVKSEGLQAAFDNVVQKDSEDQHSVRGTRIDPVDNSDGLNKKKAFRLFKPPQSALNAAASSALAGVGLIFACKTLLRVRS
eukprot:Gb_03606 [translate_table: standard]